MPATSVFDCNIIHLPKIFNRAGNITAIGENIELPFAMKRIFYLYDIPGGESRGGHAHHTLEQFVIAAGGSFDITIDDGHNKKTVHLNRPYMGLHIRPQIWDSMSNFSSGAIVLVFASAFYKEQDYIRDYTFFKNLKSL